MIVLERLSSAKSFGGMTAVYSHDSETCGCPMRFSIFLPEGSANQKLPVLYWLSGLTCTEDNFTTKAGAQRFAAQHNLILVAPDTSPRGLNLPGEDESWDFGTGAGFYLNATQDPYASHYRMYDYIVEELPKVIESQFPAHPQKRSIFGHSMGGHGALVIALRNRDRYRSVSAFAPICAPSQCPWGEKAFTGYLGPDRDSWLPYDTCHLLSQMDDAPKLFIDQGLADNFLENQLMPDKLEAVCRERGHQLVLRRQPGYDHSYYFIATFIGDHFAHHAAALES